MTCSHVEKNDVRTVISFVLYVFSLCCNICQAQQKAGDPDRVAIEQTLQRD